MTIIKDNFTQAKFNAPFVFNHCWALLARLSKKYSAITMGSEQPALTFVCKKIYSYRFDLKDDRQHYIRGWQPYNMGEIEDVFGDAE